MSEVSEFAPSPTGFFILVVLAPPYLTGFTQSIRWQICS